MAAQCKCFTPNKLTTSLNQNTDAMRFVLTESADVSGKVVKKPR